MTKINLKSKTRDVAGKKVKRHRKAGLVPAVIYGRKIASQNLWVNFLDFEKVYNVAGESTIIELDIDGKNKANVLIQDIQTNPLTGKFQHIDFFQVRMDEKIEAGIAVEFIGESPAVKELGGVLIKNLDEIPVTCLPADLPAKFEVDVSKIKTFDDRLAIKDLNISEKVKVLIDPETIIAIVSPPRSEEEMAKLSEKVEEDVTKVEGVVKETPEEKGEEKKEGKTEEKKE